MNDHVDVLGTRYDIIKRNWNDDRKLHDAYGYIEPYAKQIIVRDQAVDCLTCLQFDLFVDEVLRHEITHAFLEESGLSDWSNDEKLVDWIAAQLPKMVKAMTEAGALHNADG